jgi:transcription elongation factor Elf1
MACPVCRARQLVEISVTLKERKVTLHSCSGCDTKWWESEGERLPLNGLLELAAPSQ